MGHHNLRAEPLIIGAKSAVEGVDAMKPARKRRERKPSVGTLIKQAEKAGKTVTSVTKDGVTLTFGEPSADDVKPNGNGAYETPEDLRKLI